MKRQIVLGESNLWIVILLIHEQLYDVVKGSEVSRDLLVNSECEVRYRKLTFTIIICFIAHTKEEATRQMILEKLLEMEKQQNVPRNQIISEEERAKKNSDTDEKNNQNLNKSPAMADKENLEPKNPQITFDAPVSFPRSSVG